MLYNMAFVRLISIQLSLTAVSSVVASNIIINNINKISRVSRDAGCSTCPDVSYNTNPYQCDVVQGESECCRVCEKAYYKSGDCTYIKEHDEHGYSCSKCQNGTFQDEYNIDDECKECPLPAVTCPPGEMTDEDCDKYTGEVICKAVPSTTVPSNVTESGTTNTTTEKSTNAEGKPDEQKGTNGLNGWVIGVIVGLVCLLLLIIVGVVGFCICKQEFIREKISDCRSQQNREERMPDEKDGHELIQNGPVPTTTTGGDADAGVGHEPQQAADNDPLTQQAGDSQALQIENEEKVALISKTECETQQAADSDQLEIEAINGEDEQELAEENGHAGNKTHTRDLADDSDKYILKDGVTFDEFRSAVAEELLPKNRIPFYECLGLEKHEYLNEEHSHNSVVEKKRAVLDYWIMKTGEKDAVRVQKLLFAMWKLKFRETRKSIIEKYCILKNP